MLQQNGKNGSSTKEWRGSQALENFPSLVAQTFRVTGERGRSCSGSLTLYDGDFRKNRQFLWTASYLGEAHWRITGKESGAVSFDGFSPNKGVNHETTVFVRDRLNGMKKAGDIFRPQPKPDQGVQPKPPPPPSPPPSPPPPAPPASETAASATPATILPGAPDIAPPMLAVRIPVNRIRRNPEQPRKYFRKHALKELAGSMKADGQLQLIQVVRVAGDPKADYEIIIGERRWRAAQIGGITHLNAIVKDPKEVPDKKKQHRLCFISDHFHEGYTKLETALALMQEKENGASVEELCKICGHSVAWVYQHLALNDLVPELKELLDPSLPREQQLSFSIGYRIARIPKDRQMEVYHRVLAVSGARLQLIEVNRLAAEIVPDKSAGRPRKPIQYVRSLRWIVPRAAADALTADGYPDKAFGSLVQYTDPAGVAAMLGQIDQAINGLKSLRRKIEEACEKPPPAKPVLELTGA